MHKTRKSLDAQQAAEYKLTDKCQMPFGKYKGTKMANVPAKYLLWLQEKGIYDISVGNYIQENIDVLNKEIKK